VVDHRTFPTSVLGQLMAKSSIALAFVVALEIVIMISPFAAFFYAVFNPFLLALAGTPATRWLTAFFLPHMIVPPGALLAMTRVLGSVLFVVGLGAFLLCAIQVYAGKLYRRGVASRGLYAVIRHPQYAALGLSGLGLAILWPRFLTLVLLAVMLFLYGLLARDEERRMLARYGESYRAYMARTGRFFPRLHEVTGPDDERELLRSRPGRAAAVLVVLLIALVGSGFALRAYTISRLPLLTVRDVDVIAVTPADLAAAPDLLAPVLADRDAAATVVAARRPGHRLLAYVVPVDYTMQGMIGDTGGEWRLFEQHRTLPMIADYVLHPFTHLTEGHVHGGEHGGMHGHGSPAMKRRLIFIDVSSDSGALSSPRDDFGIEVRRRPLFFADVHLHTGEVLQVASIPEGTGWGRVPTPTF
jgi:protein-S-isoprenylcysteine O-methyltransferase Ste14